MDALPEADGFITAWQAQAGPQSAFVACPVFEIFYSGARGGGKTDAVLGEWAIHADEYGADAIGLMVRRTRVQLSETFERAKAIYRPLGASFTEAPMRCVMPNGARLRFEYLERDADADAYQGHSYTRVYIKEAGTFPSAAPILKLMACRAACASPATLADQATSG
jgi:Terminase large subunit, T4likevirus-type, N-terminal